MSGELPPAVPPLIGAPTPTASGEADHETGTHETGASQGQGDNHADVVDVSVWALQVSVHVVSHHYHGSQSQGT